MLKAAVLALMLLAQPAFGLVISTRTVLPAAACRGAPLPQMAMPKIADAKELSAEELEQEIVNAKKELFEHRKNVKSFQPVKPHLFKHTKHRIQQLSSLLAQKQQA